MTLLLETGAGVPGADAYVSVDAVTAYAKSYNRQWDDDDVVACEAAIRNASRYLDQLYRPAFQGQRTHGRKQGLEWPRKGVFVDGESVSYDEIPQELLDAVCEAAIRELAEPGSLMPDTAHGNTIRSVTADTVSVEFAGDGYTGTTQYNQILLAIKPLLAQAYVAGGTIERI